MQLIDTHTHLFLSQFAEDRDETVARALEAGIQAMLLPNIDTETVEPMLNLTGKYPKNCFPMIGLHPGSVKEGFEKELGQLETLLRENPGRFCAIGEIGLDYYWDTTWKEQQNEALRVQLGWAVEFNLPVVLHARSSFNDLVKAVAEFRSKGLRGVFHCFTGNLREARQVLGLGGFRLGIGGVVTFRNSGLGEVVARVPPESVMLETDSPFLAPVPYRGKRNESSYLRLVAEKVAAEWNWPVRQVAELTTANARELFGLSELTVL